jgi:transposase-like protein
MNGLPNEVFEDEMKARAWLESHLWPDGPICPHCGNINEATLIEGKVHAHRDGLYMCNACRKQFTVTVGTIFERSHVQLHKWLYAAFLICSSKKGISSHQLHRMLAVTYKTAWFMSMRLREAMRQGDFAAPIGGAGKIVEADETYVGGKESNKHKNKRQPATASRFTGSGGKEAAFSLVERGGSVRSFHLPAVNAKNVRSVLVSQVAQDSTLMTDQAKFYKTVGREFAEHGSVNHGIGEYVRGDIHTNTIENYFSILKRGIIGTYHHVSPQHLKRYLAEFDFRYNERMALGVEDRERTAKALKGIVGKRVTYRRTDNAAREG